MFFISGFFHFECQYYLFQVKRWHLRKKFLGELGEKTNQTLPQTLRSIKERNKTTWIILNVSTTFHLPQSQKWRATAACVGKVVINSWKQGILVGNRRQLCIGVATAPRIIMISLNKWILMLRGCHLAEHTLEPESRSAVARGWCG